MKLLPALLMSVSSATFAQDNQAVSASDSHHWLFGINGSPDYCFRDYVNTTDDPTFDQFVINYNDIEIPKLGFSIGASACYVINHRYSIDAGLQFSDKGYRTHKFEYYLPYPQASGGPYVFRSVSHYNYLDIPLRFNMTFGQRKLKFIAGIGITTNVLLSTASTTIQYVDGDRERDHVSGSEFEADFNRLNLSPAISAGIACNITEQMQLRIEPTFRYGVLKTSDAPLTDYLYSAGLNVGYYVRF